MELIKIQFDELRTKGMSVDQVTDLILQKQTHAFYVTCAGIFYLRHSNDPETGEPFFRERYMTIEEWGEYGLGMSRKNFYRYLDATEILFHLSNVSTLTHLPQNLNQCMALAEFRLEQRGREKPFDWEVIELTWKRALASEDQGEYITAKLLSLYGNEILMEFEQAELKKQEATAIHGAEGFEDAEIEGAEWSVSTPPKKGKGSVYYEAPEEPEEIEEKDGNNGMPTPSITIKTAWSLDEWKEKPFELKIIDSNRRFNTQSDESIDWAKWSFNPITGCEHKCSYCYARDIAESERMKPFYPFGFSPTIHPARFAAPFNQQVPETAQFDISYRNVFTCSMADLFGRWVPAEWIEFTLDVCRQAEDWNFLFLTKFPKRMAEFSIPQNCWMGTTIDCQARVKPAEIAFRKIDCAVKWISAEPMLENLEFNDLEIFDWIVMGGASMSSQTPAWAPFFDWVANLHTQARNAGLQIFQKTNLFSGRNNAEWMTRLKEFPGMPAGGNIVAGLPQEFKYMKSIK